MVRIMNVSNFAAFFVNFDQHVMEIIEVDGVYTEKKQTDLIYLTGGQRMSVLITAKNSTNTNFAFVGAMDPTMFDHPVIHNATGYLVYDSSKPLPLEAPTFPSYSTPYDDFNLVPYDHQPLFEPVTKQITLDVKSDTAYHQNR